MQKYSFYLFLSEQIAKFSRSIHFSHDSIDKTTNDKRFESETIEQTDENIAHLKTISHLSDERSRGRAESSGDNVRRGERAVEDKVADEGGARVHVEQVREGENGGLKIKFKSTLDRMTTKNILL